ncbi:MAG: carboxypeptidase-like regulatory domain-containing protein, partial [Cytophagaceae bacterium]
MAQTKTLQGRVQSKTTGLPLSGVTLLGNTANDHSVTDAGGNFSITVGKNTLITISYVGYETQQIIADSLTDHIVIELTPSDKSLDAVVVTALGVSRQRK